MNSREIVLLVIPVMLLAGLGFMLGRRQTDNTLSRLAAYPQSPMFKFVMSRHVIVGAGGLAGARNQTLYTTWFDPKNLNWVTEHHIDDDGHVVGRTHWKAQEFPRFPLFQSHLSEQRVAKLRQSFYGMPDSSQSPRLERLLIISFRFKEERPWQTRIYDRTNLPRGVKETLDLATIHGAVLEPS